MEQPQYGGIVDGKTAELLVQQGNILTKQIETLSAKTEAGAKAGKISDLFADGYMRLASGDMSGFASVSQANAMSVGNPFLMAMASDADKVAGGLAEGFMRTKFNEQKEKSDRELWESRNAASIKRDESQFNRSMERQEDAQANSNDQIITRDNNQQVRDWEAKNKQIDLFNEKQKQERETAIVAATDLSKTTNSPYIDPPIVKEMEHDPKPVPTPLTKRVRRSVPSGSEPLEGALPTSDLVQAEAPALMGGGGKEPATPGASTAPSSEASLPSMGLRPAEALAVPAAPTAPNPNITTDVAPGNKMLPAEAPRVDKPQGTQQGQHVVDRAIYKDRIQRGLRLPGNMFLTTDANAKTFKLEQVKSDGEKVYKTYTALEGAEELHSIVNQIDKTDASFLEIGVGVMAGRRKISFKEAKSDAGNKVHHVIDFDTGEEIPRNVKFVVKKKGAIVPNAPIDYDGDSPRKNKDGSYVTPGLERIASPIEVSDDTVKLWGKAAALMPKLGGRILPGETSGASEPEVKKPTPKKTLEEQEKESRVNYSRATPEEKLKYDQFFSENGMFAAGQDANATWNNYKEKEKTLANLTSGKVWPDAPSREQATKEARSAKAVHDETVELEKLMNRLPAVEKNYEKSSQASAEVAASGKGIPFLEGRVKRANLSDFKDISFLKEKITASKKRLAQLRGK